MRMGDIQYPAAANSPILSIERGSAHDNGRPGIRETHTHAVPEFLWTTTATATVTTDSRDWLLPPGYGMWIPADVPHAGAIRHPGEGGIMAMDPGHCPVTWKSVTGVRVSPLLRELLAYLLDADPADPARPTAESLVVRLITPCPAHDIAIAMPADQRLRMIAERLLTDPSDQRELADWADFAHASVRTLTRLFRAETGLSFAEWRTRARVRAAIQKLSTGTPVGETARQVGYRKSSAFIAVFQRVTGQTPGTYLTTRPGASPRSRRPAG
ncbi:AraC family transcriptional regulator [Micromonospora rifamycinica]|uniref:helix-turn-helix transcriptional regulator n=1 Tax=Micromonospora rifamycinica TaxID=291594 RepID=UPI0033C95BE2